MDALTFSFLTEEIVFNPEEPQLHHPFIICNFVNDEEPQTSLLSNGFTITLERTDPAQLRDGMFGACLEENMNMNTSDHWLSYIISPCVYLCSEDSLIIRIPYLTHGMQHSLEERMNCCKELNAAGKIAYRQAHNFAMISTVQQVLDLGNQTVRAAGARVVFYRIIFPGMVLEDKVYGKDGRLTLFASGWKHGRNIL